MPTKSRKTETMVGAFLFLGFGMLGAIILLFGNIGSFFKERYEIKVNFNEASGVIQGSSVRLRGAKIGQVARKPLLLGSDKIQVVLAIDEEHRIEEGSVFRIETASLLGDKEIVIAPPSEPAQSYLEAGQVVEGGGPGGLDRLQDEAQGIARETREVFREARVALQKIEKSVDEIGRVATQLTTTLDKVNGDILSDANLARVSGSLEHFEKGTASFARLGEQLEPVAVDLRETIGEVRQTNQQAQGVIRRFDPALKAIPEVIATVQRAVEAIKKSVDNLEDRKGALGALVSDPELKQDLKDFVRNLKANGILGYKDEEAGEDDPRDRFRGQRQ
jgi:phospholipid/cholesterol/gamma-HCH transport system substrate-binding protein